MSVEQLRRRLDLIGGAGVPPANVAHRHLEKMGEPERTFLAVVASAVVELDDRLNHLADRLGGLGRRIPPPLFPGTPSQPLTGSRISETTCESGEPSPAELDRMAEVLHDTVYRMGARWAELHGDRRVEWREAMRAALRAGRPNEAAVEAAAWAELKRGQEGAR